MKYQDDKIHENMHEHNHENENNNKQKTPKKNENDLDINGKLLNTKNLNEYVKV